MKDAFGAIYRWAPNVGAHPKRQQYRIVRAVTKVRGKAARRADKRARRPHRQAA